MIASATWLNPILMSSAATRMLAATANSAPPAERMTVERGRDGGREAGDAVADRPHPEGYRGRLSLGAQRAEFFQVPTRDERAVTRPGEHEGGCSRCAVERLVELVHGLQRDRVARMRPIDGDDR